MVLSLCRHLVRGGRSRPEELGPLSSRHSVRSPLGAPGSPCRLGLPAPAPGAPPHCTVGGRRARAAGARCEGSSRRLASCASGPPLLSKVALLPAGGLTPPRASERALEPQPVPAPRGDACWGRRDIRAPGGWPPPLPFLTRISLVPEHRSEKTISVQFLRGVGRRVTDVVVYVIFIVVKCKCCYLFFSFRSGLIWPM